MSGADPVGQVDCTRILPYELATFAAAAAFPAAQLRWHPKMVSVPIITQDSIADHNTLLQTR